MMSVSSALFFRNLLLKARYQLQTFSRLSSQYHKNTASETIESVTNDSNSQSHKQTQDEVTDYEVSTLEMKYVERLLPKQTVPEVPANIGSSTTPSGWVPQKDSALSLPYYIRRTKNHMLPIYPEVTHLGGRHMVKIRKVEGDIWALEKAIRDHLETLYPNKRIVSQVHEVGRFVRFKGLYLHDISDFIISKGL